MLGLTAACASPKGVEMNGIPLAKENQGGLYRIFPVLGEKRWKEVWVLLPLNTLILSSLVLLAGKSAPPAPKRRKPCPGREF